MSAQDGEEVTLLIESEVFKVKKQLLCEFSDYFRAMFSGNYVENEQREIKIDMIDANSMKIIIKYMEMGLIDLNDYPLTIVGEIASAANFLQITELIKQIEYTLDININESNWIDTLKIAENCMYKNLESLASAFGLLSFDKMRPVHIATIDRLYWYLSHPYLNTHNELDVFKFGLNWISQKELDADALLVVLFCLDVTRLTPQNLNEISALMSGYDNSLAVRIVECLHDLTNKGIKLSMSNVIDNKQYILETYTERVYNEVHNMVLESKKRLLQLTPTVPMWIVKKGKPEMVPHYMYTYSETKGFDKWMEVSEKGLWGWSVASWTPTKMVVVGGEHGRGTGNFVKDVKVYDTMRNEWISHGVELPPRRHAGITIIGDTMYIVGGVGGFRIVLDSVISYDLKNRSFRTIEKFPDTIQNPAVCSHDGKLFAGGHRYVFQYDDSGDRARWVNTIGTQIRTSCMVSFKGHIYCTQNFFSHLYRFKPNVDNQLEMITYFTNPTAAICNLGERLLVFTRTMCGQSDVLAVEEYRGTENEKPKVLFSESGLETKINDVSGACLLVLDMPLIESAIPEHHDRYIKQYLEILNN